MFNISPNPSYEHDLIVTIPGQSPEKITLTFKRAFIADLEKMFELTPVELLTEYIQGWSGVADGVNAIPFTEENKAKALQIPQFVTQARDALFDSIRGAKEKN